MDIQAIEQAAHAYAEQKAEQANSNTEFTAEELVEAFTAGARYADRHSTERTMRLTIIDNGTIKE